MYNNPPSAVLIDSGGGWFDSEKATAGFFHARPEKTLIYSENTLEIHSSQRNIKFPSDEPLITLQELIYNRYIAVGYIGYNFLESTNKGFKSRAKKDGKKFPKLYFQFYKPQHLKKVLLDSVNIFNNNGRGQVLDSFSPDSNLSKIEYENNVNKVKNYIASGDIYQVNMSQRFYSGKIKKPYNYFLNLYKTQPVPFSAYIDFGDFQLLSGSMELYLEKSGDLIKTKPIKGTIGRGSNSHEDNLLKSELENSIKERSENVMIVDLMRNDLGRICRYGSVSVEDLFSVKKYNTLFQMESCIKGILNQGTTISEIVYNTFPPGSVTGAPKRRAIEIIDELETHLRGPYCGAICLLYPDGNFKMSVAIRITITNKENSIFWAGSGIVWDSDPEKEYFETLLKSKAAIKASDHKNKNKMI